MEELVVETFPTVDFQPLIDFLEPYFVVLLFSFGVIIALLIVLIFAKGFQSNAR